MHDDDRKRILARRARFLAAAVVGLNSTACPPEMNPMVCLEPAPAPMPPAPPPGTPTGSAATTGAPAPSASAPLPPPVHKTVVGEAQNGKAGAAVVVDGLPIYVDDLPEWPEGWIGEKVQVTGLLEHRQGLDERGPAEPQVAGIVGRYQVITGGTWKRIAK